jgi:hypothetical protein
MVSLRGSRPTHPLLGLGLVSLLVGVFYVGATLPPSEQPRAAKEQSPAPESPVQSFRGTKTPDLEDLDELDAERVQSNAGASPGEDPPSAGSMAVADLEVLDTLDGPDSEILRIIEEDPERLFGGPCEAWVTEAPSE